MENNIQTPEKPQHDAKLHVGGLLPCPFCGNMPQKGHTGDGRYTAKCYECGVVMIQDRSDKLEGFWNRRQ